MTFNKIEKEINNKCRIGHPIYKSVILEFCTSMKIVVLHLFYNKPIKHLQIFKTYESKFIPYYKLQEYLNKNELI